MARSATVVKPSAPEVPWRMVELTDIAAHPRNPRRQVGDVTELKASIEQVGLIEPLVIVHAASGETAPFWLLAGHRRYAAAQLACLSEVPCILREDLDTPAAQIEAMVIENMHRQDLDPVEEGQAFQALLEFPGYTVAKLAKKVAKSQQTVRTRVAIAKLPDRVKAKVQARQITLDEASGMTEFAGDGKRLAALERAVGTRDFATTLQRVRTERDAEKAARKLQGELKKAGVRLVLRTGHGLVQVEGRHVQSSPVMLRRVLDLAPAVVLTDEMLAEHAACPGHAVVDPVSNVSYGLGRITQWLCLRPELHRDGDGDDAEDSVLGEDGSVTADGVTARASSTQQAEEAARQRTEDEAACDAARQVRDTFIRGITASTAELPRDEATAVTRYATTVMCQTLFGESAPSDWLDYLDPGLDVPDGTGDDADVRLAKGYCQTRDPHRVLLAIAAYEEESNLKLLHRWAAHWLGDHLLWLDLLVRLGHELSTWEQTRVDAARALLAEQDADEDQDDLPTCEAQAAPSVPVEDVDTRGLT